MDKEKTNGKKNQASSEEGTAKLDNYSRDEETTAADSRFAEYQPKRVNREVGDFLGGTSISRTVGGILGLFREAMKEASDYMDEHGERLEKRLIDHKRKKASFLSKSAALEQEIAYLLEQAKELPDDFQLREEE